MLSLLDPRDGDYVIAFHKFIQKSKGTRDCVDEARRRGIPAEVIAGGTSREKPDDIPF